MMDANSRKIVECIKQVRSIKLTLDPNTSREVVIRLPYNKKLHHDIALAVQSFFAEQAQDRHRLM